MNLYPVFLKLHGKSCLVIGGGSIAERKVKELLNAGAHICIISPELTENLKNLVKIKAIHHKSRKYRRGDVKKHFLVIAATNSPAVNREIAREAEQRPVLLNAVDNPENCNFFVPAALKRGALHIAVSTSGTIPLFAREMRVYLEKKITPWIIAAMQRVESARKTIIDTVHEPGKKKEEMDKVLKPMIQDILKELDRQWLG